MTRDDSERLHGAHEDERTRDHREKRIRAEATADAHALARRRCDPLLPYTELRYDPDDDGCVW